MAKRPACVEVNLESVRLYRLFCEGKITLEEWRRASPRTTVTPVNPPPTDDTENRGTS